MQQPLALEVLNSDSSETYKKKYLTFVLCDEEYGIEILKVREIIGLQPITSVPRTAKFIKGIINLRGKVIPVIDLRIRFEISEVEYTKETCIIVVDAQDLLMGIIVDSVCEVLAIKKKDIEPTPALGDGISADFILGMGRAGDEVKIILDIDEVLAIDEHSVLE